MKIKLDKDFIRASKVDEIKEAAKAFKEMYTDDDLACAFESVMENTADIFIYHTRVVECEVEAFEFDFFGEAKPRFYVRMTLENHSSFYKIRFYTDETLEITGSKHVDEYKLV